MSTPGQAAKRRILELVQRGELGIGEANDLLSRIVASHRPAPGHELVAFTPGWVCTDPPQPTAADGAGLVVIVDGADWPASLMPPGGTLVEAGPGFRRLGADHYVLDPRRPDNWTALFDGLAATGWSRLVYLTAAGAVPPEECLEPLLPALQALIRDRTRGEVGLAFVAAGGGHPETVDVLGGFAQVVGLEDGRLPAVAIQVADLPEGFTDPVRLALAEMELPRPGGAEIRYDRAGRWIRELRPATVELAAPSPSGTRGAYLVTGGAGGLALRIAELLAARASARFVLVGRSELTDADRRELRRVELLGGEVSYLVGDVTRYADVAAAVAHAKDRYGRIDGVLHSAGVNEDAYILNKDPASLRRVLAPKLAGARNLDRATRDEPLEFFVLFSSMAAYLGGAGQCDYAAANRALGGFARERASAVAAGDRRGTTVSVAWPLWIGGGMDLAEDDRKASEILQGMVAMPPAVGLAALTGAIAADEPEALVVYGDGEQIRAFADHRMAPRARTTGAAGSGPAPAATVEDLGAAVERYLLELVSGVLRLPPERLQPDQEFSTIGVDSILIRRISATLEDQLGSLPVTLLFEHRTVRDLARHLTGTHPDKWATLLGSARPEPAVWAEQGPARDGIAIVGIAGRYPGGNDLNQFWESLAAGRDCTTRVPPERWDNTRFFDPARSRPGTTYADRGGFIDDVTRFDTLFFGISPREAERMDPAERQFLEVAWTALEDAGYSRHLLHRRTADGDRHAVGVFVGANGLSYELVGAEQWGRGNPVPAYSMDFSIANRLSYVLDVHGPSFVVDTACSSSLTALHLACESLRRGECRMAVAGGVYLSLHPLKYAALSELRMLSADGRCRAFGAGADGFVPGEGVGALVLKPLAAAVADGDHIHAVIRATSVNHGGRTNGYTVPSPKGQSAVVAETLSKAGVHPRSVGYVEAHGTGTALGDPIEIEGLSRAFGDTGDRQYCAIGSVKTNIGHAESAAGVAGITKVVLQFRHGALAPTLHCDPPNPKIDFVGTPFALQRTLAPWPRFETRVDGRLSAVPRRATVSSFGAGGANAHVVLEQYEPEPEPAVPERGEQLVVLSAKTPDRLRTVAERLCDHLDRQPSPQLRDLAYTLRVGRDALEHRLAVTVGSIVELRDRLRSFLAGEAGAVALGQVEPGTAAPGDTEHARTLLAGRAWDELGRLWVAGAQVPWDEAETAGESRPRHLPLPTYPFAGGRHWVDTPATPAILDAPASHEERRTFRSSDPVVADHVVGGRAVVAGVVHLELSRAAAAALGRGPVRALSDIRWRAPLEVGDDPLTVPVSLTGAGDTLDFRTGDPARPAVTGTIHIGPAIDRPTRLDLAAIRARCRERIDGAQLYARATRAGLDYGPTYQRVRALWRSDTETLAELEPAGDEPGTRGWLVHPGLTDAALQAIHGVAPDGADLRPASVTQVEVWGGTADARFAHVRLRAASTGMIRCDVTLADAGGARLLALHDFQAVRDIRATGDAEPADLPYFRTVWRLRPAPPAASPRGSVLVLTTGHDGGLGRRLADRHGPASRVVDLTGLASGSDYAGLLSDDLDRVYFLGGVDDVRYSADDLDHLDAAQETGCLALFHLAQALAERRPSGLHLTVVTSDVQQIDEGVPATNPFAASLLGLTRAVARELPFLQVSCVDIAGADVTRSDALAAQVAAEPASEPLAEVALRGGCRLVRYLERAVLDEPDHVPFRTGGRYLVIGGAGGLGLAVSRYLAQEHAARLVLIGRRPAGTLPGDTRQAIAAAGAEYRQCDVGDPDGMRAVVAEMRERLGGIDGVIHSAFVLADRTIARMDDETFRAALWAKARGTVVLRRVLEGEALDFLALFSSGIAHTGNPGQANYAAASTFQDAYGRYLATGLRLPVKVFNWGFWGDSGSVATDEYRRRVAQWGVQPLSDAEGVAAFRQVMGSPVVQVSPLKVSTGLARAALVEEAAVHHAKPAEGPSRLPDAVAAARTALLDAPSLLAPDYLDVVEAYARRAILDALRRMGVLRGPGERYHLADLRSRLGVVGSQHRLFDALLTALCNGGYAHRAGDVVESRGGPAEDAAALRTRVLDRFPHMAASLSLMADCADALPDVLTGRRRGLEVLFPGGSDHRLAPLYHDDPRAKHFNTLCAAAVDAFVAARIGDLPGRRCDLLEIGAGTGGTSRPVLAALDRHGSRLHYDYTDISPALVGDARERLGPAHPYADFKVLDIEGDLAPQGFDAVRYDVVLATNVLHATRDIRHTLRNVKRLLRPGGLFVLNESTRVLDCVTLIFGLTDGWWFAHDGDLRMAYSPLLNVDQWRGVLADIGLHGVSAFGIRGWAAEQAGQHLIVAESDAWRPLDAVPVPLPPPTPRPTPMPADGAAASAVEAVSRVFGLVLKMDPAELDPAAPLDTYGVDSLVTMEVRERLEKELGPIPGNLPFEGGSIAGIARALSAHFGSTPAAAAALPTPTTAALPAPAAEVRPAVEAAARPAETGADEPIAIIGIAGRYPGADDVWEFWENLRAGRRCIRQVPADRRSGTGPVLDGPQWGGFLEDVDRFDPLLFRISPRDAARMDPQERLFLQTAWAALEDAGYPPRRLQEQARRDGGAGVGVYVGVMHGPYQLLAAERWGRGEPVLAHSAYWSVANRVSHCAGFTGPSMAVDTACSSSLTALHLACEAIRRGDCAAAVVGGVNVILHQSHHLSLSTARMLSPDGHGRAFAAGADGMVTGEGVGAVILKPLASALRDGDRIWGTVLGSAVNANGTTASYVTPSADAQTELIERALRRSGLNSSAIGYVEAQATGSALSDPVEIAALSRVFGPGGRHALGSVKPAIGHLEAAAGMAQLTKVLLQMRHGELVPTVDCTPLRPDVAESPFDVVQRVTPWPADRVRLAAVSSFGAGGANAHVVVAEPPAAEPSTPDDRAQLVVLSARRPAQLREQVRRLRDAVAGGALPLADVAWTTQIGRTPLSTRLAVVARDGVELTDRLTAYLDDRPAAELCTGTVPAGRSAGPVPVPGEPDPARLADLARAWTQGADVDWTALHRGRRRHIVSLPSYPFARERHWLDEPAAGPDIVPAHPIAPPRPSAQVRDLVVAAIGDVLGVRPDDIDLDCHLSDFGFDSITIVELAARLENALGGEVSPATLYGYPDVAALIAHLDQPTLAAAPPTVEPAGPAPTVAERAPEPAAVPGTAEPIAIIGVAGMFPGAADVDAFWTNLVAGSDLVREIPPDRFNWRAAYPGEVSRWGAFLDDIDAFDADFFRISPREARVMDPQHRLFLQAVWHAVEDAGYDPTRLGGSTTGVFVGVASADYATLAHARGVEVDGQLTTGNDHSVLANRVSFLLDLHGPSEPVHTACSSSLVAVHRAVRALRDGDCELALAGGVNVLLNPEAFVAFGRSGMLAPDGRCKTFDHRADGYVRGEGVGAVLLKRLDAALADGDHVYAVITGTAINHGGRSASLTAPNPNAQADVIVRAHREAGSRVHDIGYVEAHGTGTALGDPVELAGLTTAFQQLGADGHRQYCALGSVKTNIGHLETAAGIAGLIKVVLALRHRTLPPALHVERLNPLIQLAGTPFHLVDTARAWDPPRDDDGRALPRRAGVSSFGFGGVNAHIVVAEHAQPPAPSGGDDPTPQVFALSARTPERLRAYAAALASYVDRLEIRGGLSAVRPADVAYTLQVGRPALGERVAVVAHTLEDLTKSLRAYLGGDERPPEVFVADGEAPAGEAPVGGGEPQDVAARWVRGEAVDWADLHRGRVRRRTPLPAYPFTPDRYWLPDPPPEPARAAEPAPPRLEIKPAPLESRSAQPAEAGSGDVLREVREAVAEGIGVEPDSIDPAREFATYGIDSLGALRIMQRIQARYGDHIPMAAILESPTVERLADHLVTHYLGDPPPPPPQPERPQPEPVRREPAAAPARVIPLAGEPGDDRCPWYALFGDTGELTWLLHARSTLAADGPVRGVDAPGFGTAAPPERIEEMAAACLAAIVADRPEGPVRVAGSGLAGLVAVEVARALLDRGRQVAELLLLATPEPGAPAADPATAVPDVMDTFCAAWSADRPFVAEDPTGDPAGQVAAAAEFLRAHATVPIPAERLADRIGTAAGWRRALARAASAYQPRPLAGVDRTTVVRLAGPDGPDAGDWRRWIAPPPEAFHLAADRRGLAAPGTAAELAKVRGAGAEPVAASTRSPLVSINRQGTGGRSFWMHHLYGEVSYGVYLSRHLGLNYPILGLEQVDMDSRVHQFSSIEDMAARYVAAIREEFPDGPYLVGGCSFGGVVAFEVTRQLQLAGARVSELMVIDPIMPGTGAWDGIDWGALSDEEVLSLSVVILGNAYCQRWAVAEQIQLEDIAGKELDDQLEIITRHIVDRSPARPSQSAIADQIKLRHEVLLTNNDLLVAYRPQVLTDPVHTTVFHAGRGFLAPDNSNNLPEVKRRDGDRSNGFAGYVSGPVDIHDMPEDHFSIAYDASLRTIATLLRPALDSGDHPRDGV